MRIKEAELKSNSSHPKFSRIFSSNFVYYSVVPLTVGIVSYIYLRQFTPLYLDSWHDGYMLANAYAIRDGAVPYRDIFQIYGMTTTWIHGLIQPETGHTVLSLRNLSVALSSLTATLICLTPLMGFKKWISVLSAVLWIALADYSWSDDTWWVLPWSTVTATLLVTILLLLVGVAIRIENREAHSTQVSEADSSFLILIYLLSGLVVVALVFTRIVPGFLAAGGVFLILTQMRSHSHRFRRLGSYLLGLTIGILTTIFYLNWFAAIEPFWYQTFAFSTKIFSIVLVFFHPGMLVSFLLIFTGSVSVILLLVFLRLDANTKRILFKRLKQKKSLDLFLILSVFSILTASFVYSYLRGGQLWGATAFSGVVRFLFWAIFLLNLFTIVFSIALLFIQRSVHHVSEHTRLNGLVAIFAIISFSSVVPSISPRYVWWAMPIGLLVLTNVLRGAVPHIHQFVALVSATFVIILGCALLIGASSVREVYIAKAEKGTGIFAGLYVSPGQLEKITRLSDFLNENREADEKFYNWCPDPLPTFISGGFSSASPVLSNHVPGNATNPWQKLLSEAIRSNFKSILVCDTSPKNETFRDLLGPESFFHETISDDGTLRWLSLTIPAATIISQHLILPEKKNK